MEPGALGIVANLDLRIGQLAKFFDGFYVRRPHIGSGDDTQLAAILGELPQLIHKQTQPAPLDEGYQHVDAVGGHDVFLQCGSCSYGGEEADCPREARVRESVKGKPVSNRISYVLRTVTLFNRKRVCYT